MCSPKRKCHRSLVGFDCGPFGQPLLDCSFNSVTRHHIRSQRFVLLAQCLDLRRLDGTTGAGLRRHLSTPLGGALGLTKARKFTANSLRDAIAAHSIRDFHRRTGADYGPFGVLLGALTKAADGSYHQQTQLGNIHLADLPLSPSGEIQYRARVTLSALKCFGTQDRTTDETYAIISIFAIDPNQGGSTQTIRTEILENVHKGDTIFKMRPIGDIIPVGSGIGIYIAIWDHESGNADEIRDKIAAVIEDGTNKAADAIAGAAGADDPSVSAGDVGKVTEFEVGGIKPVHILTLELADLLAHALADDLIGDHYFFIPAANIVDFADQTKFEASVRKSPDNLDFDVQLNWPPRPEDEPLFTDGHGTYKAYFLIQSAPIIPLPVLPKLS